MRLKKVRLHNFRSHNDSTIDAGDATFLILRGPNFAGKSSIAQGISMLLTPSTEGLDSSGRGFVAKIKRGETKATLVGEIQGKSHTIQRTVALNTNSTGRTDHCECIDDPEWHPAPFENFLKSNRDALGVCLNTSAFIQMDEKAQKSLLAKFALPSHYDFPSEKLDAVEKIIGQGTVNFGEEPFSVIEKAYKLCYAERQIVNGQVKEFTIPDAIASASVDAASLQKELEIVQDTRRKLIAEKDAAVKKSGAQDVERATLTQQINGLLEKVENGKSRLKDLEPKFLTLERLREIKEIAARKEDRDTIQKMIAEGNGAIAEREKRIARYKALPVDLKNCLSCGQSVPEGYIATLIQQEEQELAMARKGQEERLVSLKEFGDVDAAIKQLAVHETALVERAKTESSLKEIVETGKQTRAKLAALGEKSDIASGFVKPLDEVDKRIAELNEQLRPAIAAEERAKEIQIKTQKLEKLKAKAEKVDSLVKYFDKDGIKAELLAEHITPFERRLNEVLSAWGYKCSLSIEPYQFNITTAAGDTSPFRELSKAEKQLFNPAFQCAVSVAAGIGMVVIDDMDTPLKETGLRDKLYGKIYELVRSGVLEQAIMIEASADSTLPARQAPGSAYFFVENGTVKRLGIA